MKLKQLNENFIHKINIYPVINVVYDGQIQAEYDFEEAGEIVEISVCLKPGDGEIGDPLVEPFMNKINFDDLEPLKDEALEKFKGEKFLVDPEKLTKDKVKLTATKAWAYAKEEKEE